MRAVYALPDISQRRTNQIFCDTTKHDCMMGFVCMRNLLIALMAAASNGILCRFEGVLTCLIFRRTYDQLMIPVFSYSICYEKGWLPFLWVISLWCIILFSNWGSHIFLSFCWNLRFESKYASIHGWWGT